MISRPGAPPHHTCGNGLRHHRVNPMVQLRSRIFRQMKQKFAGCSGATDKNFFEIWRKRCKQVCHSGFAQWCLKSSLRIPCRTSDIWSYASLFLRAGAVLPGRTDICDSGSCDSPLCAYTFFWKIRWMRYAYSDISCFPSVLREYSVKKAVKTATWECRAASHKLSTSWQSSSQAQERKKRYS